MRTIVRFLFCVCLISVLLISCNTDADNSNKANNRCTIILHPNNGNPDIVYYGMQGDFLTLPTPFKLNHSFSYWFDSNNNMFGAGNQFAYSSTRVLELWGRWSVKIDLPESYEDIYGQSELPVVIPGISGEGYCPFWIKDNNERIYPGTITCPFDNFKLDLVEHAFDSGVISKPNSCVGTGEMTYTCRTCGTVRTEVIPVDSEAHLWNNGELYPNQSEPEGILYTCKTCGATKIAALAFSEEWTSDALNHWHTSTNWQNLKSDTSGHSFSNEVEIVLNDDKSIYSAVERCKVCGYTKGVSFCPGYVFYDKGYYSDGWRYLEAAPADLKVIDGVPSVDSTIDGYSSASAGFPFGYYKKGSVSYCYVSGGTVYSESDCTRTGIGTGKINTQLLVSAMGDEAYSNSYGTDKTKNYAARLCDVLEYTADGITYDDWFLPSKDELNLMFFNLNLLIAGLGGSAGFTYYYWSSSEGNNTFDAWYQNFSHVDSINYGSQVDGSRYITNYVRPVRVF